MKVYAINVSKINPDDKKWYKYLSDKRIEKVENLRKPHKKSQSIGAELVLNYAIRNQVGAKAPLKWDTDENGKLYLVDYTDLYVNLSHSGDFAVCAVNDTPVGVDIQYCRECDIKIAERFFSACETEFVNNSADKNNAFFKIWTRKESFVKAIGKGITIPLNSFSVLDDTIEYEGGKYHFREYSVSQKGYILSVCYKS